MIDDIDEKLLKLEPAWGRDKIEKLRLIYQIGDDDRKERIRKIVSLSLKKLVNDSFLPDELLLPPSSKKDCLGKGEIYLGNVCYGKHKDGRYKELYPLFLNLNNFATHLLISGATGTGKTSLAYNLAIELAKKNINIIIFDWQRTWRTLLSLPKDKYPFVENIKVYTIGRNDIAPFKGNLLFHAPKKVPIETWMEIITSAPLEKSLLGGLGVQNIILDEAQNILEAYQNGILKLFPNIEDVKKGVSRKFLKGRAGLWQQSALRLLSLLTRSSAYDVFSSRDFIDLEKDIFSHKGIIIFEMDLQFPNSLRILFQETFLLFLLSYFLGKGESDNLQTVLIFEEFQNMVAQSQIERQVGSDILKNLFREGRKFGLSAVCLAQEPSTLGNHVLANCRTTVSLSSRTKKDIETIANGLFLKQKEIPFIDYLKRGECIIKVDDRVKNCLVKTPAPPPFQRKITDEELKVLMKKWQHQN
ncbi:MAG: ATP-binding protein [Candidatus Aureabacteria bacterium]|nr:ATP-binding protein [Candidatus Auribacterota bacterium]